MKKVLVPIANGSEEIEAVTIIDMLRRAQAQVTVASVHAHKEITAARGTHIVADALLEECVYVDYDLIALPGGMPGAEHLRDCPLLIDRLHKQNQSGKLYAAICASPSVVLETHGLLQGKIATGYPGFHLSDESDSEKPVVVSGNCITSRGVGTALAFSLELIELLFGRALRDKIAKSVLVL
ncbi:MAG: DJ-1/PfpI family protein [Deferribacteres bacterium]|nr:DJ-1/PfpI family protein [candidate division KSB1 bacterium]MCB9501116.1 DJ-1/PfpI family protein [Deferribacteres bacterium]